MKSFICNSVKFWLALSLISTLHFAQLLASRNIFIELTDNELVAEPIKTGPFLEENGLLIMEMESTVSPLGLWIKKTDVPGYTGTCHFEFTGNSPASGTPKSPLTYTFKINKAGIYHLNLRARKRLEGEPGDRCNDCYVRMEGDFVSGNPAYPTSTLTQDTKLFGGTATGWGWATNLDGNGAHNTDAAIYDFKAGETYTLRISGRSQRFNLDRIVLRHSSVTNTVARDPSKPESQRDGGTIEPPPPVNHLLLPAKNFTVQAVDGFVPFYVDSQRGCLAVNSILYPNQFAAARTYFNGTSGTYDITITTLSEIDGEPSYKLRINGTYIGSPYTQPYTGVDYSPLTHTWPNVSINNGDTIQVESNSVSNGLVPEGDAFAFARGRWTQLELTHITTVHNDLADRKINVFPNPGNGVYKLNVSGFPAGQLLSLKVVDAQGRNIHTMTGLDHAEGLHNYQIDLSEKSAGIYFILLLNNTEKIYSYKVIKN